MSRHHVDVNGPKFTLGVVDQWVVIYDKSHIMQKRFEPSHHADFGTYHIG